jgi:FeS assembly SUF system regulator
MLRISKITDYGTLVLVYLADRGEAQPCPASEVAAGVHLSLPITQKVLKLLTRGGMVCSSRGAGGGYQLARPAAAINAAEILDVLEGPVAITECSHDDGDCQLESNCQVGNAWRKISVALRIALKEIKLTDLHQPPREFPLQYTVLKASGHGGRLADKAS